MTLIERERVDRDAQTDKPHRRKEGGYSSADWALKTPTH